jgi:hypothetical protein
VEGKVGREREAAVGGGDVPVLDLAAYAAVEVEGPGLWI